MKKAFLENFTKNFAILCATVFGSTMLIVNLIFVLSL